MLHFFLIHPLPVVFVFELPQHLEFAIHPKQGDIGMRDAVEHICLHGGIMEHVLKDDLFADLERVVELPRPHEVACQTTVSAQPIDKPPIRIIGSLEGKALGPSHAGLIGHFQTVGHVAGETHVEDGRFDAMVVDDVHHI